MSNPRFELYLDSANEFRFRLISVNGRNILHSTEGYTTKQNCQKGNNNVPEYNVIA